MSADRDLRTLALPTTNQDWAPFVDQRCAEHLRLARAGVAHLTDGSRRDARQVLRLWDDVNLALDNATSVAGLVAQVHPDEKVRSLAERCEREANTAATEIGLDRALFDALSAVDDTELDDAGRRVLSRTLRDFRRSGVDQDAATRDRIRALSEAEKALCQDFAKNIRDDVRSIRVTPDRLAGLPQDYLDAHPADADGLVTITTDYPDFVPFRTFATDAAARRAITVESLNRAWPVNDAVLGELLALRREHAALLGYESWAAYDAEVKMVGSAAGIGEFLADVRDRAAAPAARDHDLLLARLRADVPDATGIDASDVAFYSEVIRRERFDVDAQQVRTYFDFAKVRAGLLEVTGRLFGLEYHAVPDAPVWHPDVTAYDVHLDGTLLGRAYLDLRPRDGKFKHAAQFSLVSGLAGRQLPEGVLVCNFPRGLMEHSHVVTLFHEFGHLIHHILAGRQEWQRFSGVATEWDFAEAPSQMLEEWAMDADVLASFATNGAGEPIPADLVARMRTAKDFAKGCQTRTQLFYAALSYALHREPVDDITALVRRLQTDVDAFGYIEDTHVHTSFVHLEGYTSGYYTYQWSLVIAKDLFAAFDAADLFDTTTAYRYRDTVLAAGGRHDAAQLVTNFLGRPYTVDAFSEWLAR